MRYAILGAGWMGQEHMRNIALMEGCEIAGFLEPDAEMRAGAAALAPGARPAASLEDLLGEPRPDALVIATPNCLHAANLREVAAIRPLPILVEKPLVTRPEDRALVDWLAAFYPAPIWVGMEYRYMPPLARFLEEVEEVTGGVRHLSIREHRFPFLSKVGNWNRFNCNTGGTMVEKCCHFFDLMRLIAGEEPVRVWGSGWQAVNHKDEIGGEVPDIWDAAFTVVEFGSGIRAMLDLCMFADGVQWQEEITAVGPDGRIDCLIPPSPGHWPPGRGPCPHPQLAIWPRRQGTPTRIELPIDDQLAAAGSHHGATFFQHQAFRRMIEAGGEPEVGLRDGWMAVRVGIAAQDSSETGQAVRLD